MKTLTTIIMAIMAIFVLCTTTQLSAQEVLPFPEPPSASKAGKTLKDSKHQWRTTPNRLPEDAPNIVIFMTDDAGFSNPSTFGGPVRTPTLDCLSEFHNGRISKFKKKEKNNEKNRFIIGVFRACDAFRVH